MADAYTVITLDDVHAGIVSAISAQFPDLQTVEFYRLDRKNLPVPACLLDLVEMDGVPELDPGTEELAVNARFAATFAISFRQGASNPKLEVRKLAAAFAAFARLQRWGSHIGPAEVAGCYPSDFDPELDQYECWRVEWVNVIHLGNTVWTDGGVETPSQVLVGFAPKIGTGHVADYTTLIPSP